jgi:hypothetical protein
MPDGIEVVIGRVPKANSRRPPVCATALTPAVTVPVNSLNARRSRIGSRTSTVPFSNAGPPIAEERPLFAAI